MSAFKMEEDTKRRAVVNGIGLVGAGFAILQQLNRNEHVTGSEG